MIQLSEISYGIKIITTPIPTGFNVIAKDQSGREIAKLQIGRSSKPNTAVVWAADVEESMQRQGIGTSLYQAAYKTLKKMGIKELLGAIEGSGIVQIREKVFGKGNTKYYSGGTSYTADEAIQIMDVNYGRLIAVTTIK